MIYLAQRAAARNSKPQTFRTRVVRCGGIVIFRRDGLRKSVPVFRRRAIPIGRLEARS